MKKCLFNLLAFLLLSIATNAQVNTYSFYSSVGTYTPLPSEGILWSGGFDDAVSAPITIPSFTMAGISYTTMYVSTNGFITLGTTGIPTSTNYIPISWPEAMDVVISPFGGDLQNADAGTPKISANTNYAGEIVVQWQDVRHWATTYAGQRISFQIRLNPSTGEIKFVYGGTITGVASISPFQVGLRGATNADFNNRTTATNWSATAAGLTNDATCAFSSAVLPASGLTYTFSPCSTITTLPFKESFDGTTFPPTCWENMNTAGAGYPGTWDRQTAGIYPTCTPHTGAGMARFDSFDYYDGTTGILVTPQLALPSDQYEVHFWMYRDNGYPGYTDRVNVYCNTAPNTANASLLGTVNRNYAMPPAVTTANQWYEYVFTMPSGSSGNTFIIFEGVSNYGNNIYIDDVKVKAIFNCPSVSTAELEPCGSDLNGGCNMTIPAFEPISLGETKCGTGWFDGTIRDTDWYIFTLTEQTDVTLTVSAEFPVLMGFIAAPCPAYSFIDYNTGIAVPPISITTTLAAGTYYAYVAPDFSTIITCGGEDKYWARLEIATPPGATAETEPCGADLNGGCNMSTPAFEPITLGETIDGTSWCNGSTRDTDWYIFMLTQKTRVTLTTMAEFPVQIILLTSPCISSATMAFNTGAAGSAVSATAVLDPGTYYAWIGPTDWTTIIQCGGADKYWATLTGSTCFEPTGLTVSSITAVSANLSWTAPSPVPANGYSWEIRTSGDPGSGSVGLAASGSTTLLSVFVSGLTPNTPFFAYVRSDCSANDFSPWSTAAQFSTPSISQNLAVSAVIQGGQSVCYDALQTITVAGGGTSFVIMSGGSATMIAGQNIRYLPSTLVVAGGYMHGYIAPNGPFCVVSPQVKEDQIVENEVPAVTEKASFKIYPNPTTGTFTLEQKSEEQLGRVSVEIYGMRGDRILSTQMIGERSHQYSLSEMAPGVYIIHVASGADAEVFKIIKY